MSIWWMTNEVRVVALSEAEETGDYEEDLELPTRRSLVKRVNYFTETERDGPF